jgi:hypothetical protein
VIVEPVLCDGSTDGANREERVMMMRLGTRIVLLGALLVEGGSSLPTRAEDTQNALSSGDAVAVMEASGSVRVVAPSADRGAIPGWAAGSSERSALTRPLMPAPDPELCHIPEMTVAILDPVAGRAVVREGSRPPRVVRPGSVLSDPSAVVREIGPDQLIVEVEKEDGGPAPVLWIYAAEAPGEASRVRCFVATTSPPPAPRSVTAEPLAPH